MHNTFENYSFHEWLCICFVLVCVMLVTLSHCRSRSIMMVKQKLRVIRQDVVCYVILQAENVDYICIKFTVGNCE
jgi:hypothetical protein